MALTGEWKKGSKSNGTGGSNCVEVRNMGRAILVRDSKNPNDPAMAFTPAEWTAFIESVKLGEFDL